MTFPEHLPQKIVESLKIEMELPDFCRKALERLNNEIEKTLEKCTEFYKNMRQVHDRCHIYSAAKINDFPNKDRHVAYLHDILHEDEQYIQKIEIINEEDVRTWVAQAYVSNYILEDLYRTTPKRVTRMETQLVIHKVTMQMLELINYRTISE